MKINKVGWNFRHTGDFAINRPKGSGDYLLLIVKTRGIFHLKTGTIQAVPGSFILFEKDSPQLYRIADHVYINDWVHFDADENDLLWLRELNIPMDTAVPLPNSSALSQNIQNIYYEVHSANPLRSSSAELWLRLLFVKLAEQLRQKETPELAVYQEKLSRLRTKIYAEPAYPWTVDEMAKELTVSKSYLQHLYKKVYRTGPISDVINSRIEHGKYLLITTGLSVGLIAELCGYRSDVHFMRQFKAHTGVTPSTYRKQSGAPEDAAFFQRTVHAFPDEIPGEFPNPETAAPS